jgi:tetratricopeptide (TPR) repeat protein
MANHPRRESIRRFVVGELPVTEAQRIDRHLSICSECRDYADEVFAQMAIRQLDSWSHIGYDEAIERAAEQTIEKLSSFMEDPQNPGSLLAELFREPISARRRQIAEDDRFHSLRLCQLLQSRCRSVWIVDPVSALEMADLAVEISRSLDSARYGSNVTEDARALAWAYLGNSFRITSDLWSSEKALRQAWCHHARAGEDAYTESEILMFTASLRNDQNRHEEAIRLSDRAISIYREGQDRHLEGAALILKGLILGDHGSIHEAIPALRAGLDRIDPDEDPRLLFAGNHNLTYCLAKSDSPEKAQQLIDRNRTLCCNLGEIDLARVHWVEGVVAGSVGRFVEAEKALREVLDFFLLRDLGIEVFVSSLNLGQVYALSGQYGRVKEVLGELIPLGEALGLKQEVFLARMLYETAIRH